MNVHHIFIDDNNPDHLALSIYRTGVINRIHLDDSTYKTYGSFDIDAHDYSALFHYGIAETLNGLPFMSETGNGFDSWDEAYLHNSSLAVFEKILAEAAAEMEPDSRERILLGWQDQPASVAYLRKIDSSKFIAFLDALRLFTAESAAEGYDLEFIL
ncbi:MAG: hypothetical protein HGB36_01860 [Chlorobiaceae bacterium]|nr:hypothetical protein [Chlorobiaceae bacterium]